MCLKKEKNISKQKIIFSVFCLLVLVFSLVMIKNSLVKQTISLEKAQELMSENSLAITTDTTTPPDDRKTPQYVLKCGDPPRIHPFKTKNNHESGGIASREKKSDAIDAAKQKCLDNMILLMAVSRLSEGGEPYLPYFKCDNNMCPLMREPGLENEKQSCVQTSRASRYYSISGLVYEDEGAIYYENTGMYSGYAKCSLEAGSLVVAENICGECGGAWPR